MNLPLDCILKRIICMIIGHDPLYSAVVGPGEWGAIKWECECGRCGKDLTTKTEGLFRSASEKLDSAALPTRDRKMWPPPDEDQKVKLWPWMKR